MSRIWSLVLLGLVGLVIPLHGQADGNLVFSDDFEDETIGNAPGTPVLGPTWVNTGAVGVNSIRANPLVNAIDDSSKVMRNQRIAQPAAGYSWIDLSAGNQALLAAGQLLTVDVKFRQPDLNQASLEIGMYDNGTHGFTANAIDLAFLSGGGANRFTATGNQFVPLGPTAGVGWDLLRIVVDFTTDTWTFRLNGGTIVTSPFTNNNNMTKVQTIMFTSSFTNSFSYVDDVNVYVGAVPEPSTIVLACMAIPAIARLTQRRSRR